MMKRVIFPLSLVILIFLVSVMALSAARAARQVAAAPPKSTPPASSPDQASLFVQAVQQAIGAGRAKTPLLQIYRQSIEQAQLSSDGEWGRAWLVSQDPATGQPAPSEPGLVLAHWDGLAWQVFLPSDPGWAAALRQAPLNLVSQATRDVQLESMTQALAPANLPTSAFTGYRLPWAAGAVKYLSQSTYHDYYTPSGTAHYAFDFYVHDQIWPILAAKPGIVWKYYDAVPTCYELNCGQDLGNYIIIQDPTTNPVSYILYLHLAQYSIPAQLKKVGALVTQAQFIGNADNTGQSWGDHLHFMVHTNPNSYWGQSVDIRFSDVPINGGRPRVPIDKAFCTWAGDVCNDFSSSYTSFNTPVNDNSIPTAGFYAPGNGNVIAARTLNLSGWGQDPQAGMFALTAFVNYTSVWQPVATSYFSTTVSAAWDWCTAGVPNGPVSLGIQATDLAGHVSQMLGVRTVTKSFTCPVTSAGIDQPTSQTVVKSSQVTLSGWGVGAQGLLSLQALANFNDTWQNVGAASATSPYSFQWDMCASGVPDGPVSVAFKATDLSGETSPLVNVQTFIKQYACPPPVPAYDRVLICTQAGYQDCYSFGKYQYASGDVNYPMDPLPDASAYSIRVGSDVQATLFDNRYYGERGTTFFGDDPNLEDNLLREQTLSSFVVRRRSALPSTPNIPAPSGSYQEGDVVTLYWENTGGGTEFQVQLTGTLTSTTTVWQPLPYLHLAGLPQGAYTWEARARNLNGVGSWSTPGAFTISSLSAPSIQMQTAPYSDSMETSSSLWTASGLWSLGSAANAATPAHNGDHAWWYQDQSASNYTTGTNPNWGDLTSPPISIPGPGYYLRFWYDYDTETGYPYFDQRWVQISTDGGPFKPVHQLTSDVEAMWLQSPFIDLTAYAGHAIRVRFHFETLDKKYNSDRGWAIDDFSITQAAPPTCNDTHDPNNDPGHAALLAYGESVDGQICPQGEVDYYAFTGAAGDRIGASIDAQSIGSSLDAELYLLDSSGGLLTWNDDRISHVLIDPQLFYRLPQNGTYYLKVIAWDHPSAGGPADFYRLKLFKDFDLPQISMVYPTTNGVIPTAPFKLQVSVSDALSGVSRVDFMWHSSNWASDSWNTLGSDWDGSDGWSVDFDAASLAGQQGLAFYAQAYDLAGNTAGAAAWNVSVISDATPPSLAVQPIIAPLDSTLFQLQWTASDTQSGIDHFAVQVSDNGGAWQDYDPNVPPAARSLWYGGAPGRSYAFQMQAVDRAGNVRPFPALAEASTSVETSVCPSLDAYEPDSLAAPTPITTDGISQLHNFCSPPLGSAGLNDQDWVSFNAQAGNRYLIMAVPQNPAAAVSLVLLASDKVTVLAQFDPDTFGKAGGVEWKALNSGLVYLRMSHINPAAAGSLVTYRIAVYQNNPVYYLPLIN